MLTSYRPSSNQKGFRCLWRALCWQYVHVVLGFKAQFALLLLQVLVLGAAPAVLLAFLRQALNSLLTPSSTHETVLYIAAYVLVNICSITAGQWQSYLVGSLAPRVEIHITSELNNAIANIPFAVAEQASFLNRANQLIMSVQQGPVRLISEVGNSATYLFTTVGLMAFLASVRPAMAIAVIVAVVPGYLRSRCHSEEIRAQWVSQVPKERYAGYLSYLAKALGPAIELRLVNASRYIEDKWRGQKLRLLVESEALRRHQVRANLASAGFGAAMTGGCLMWLAITARNTALDLGTVAALVQGLSSAYAQLQSFMGSLNRLHECALAVSDLSAFIDETQHLEGVRVDERVGALSPWPPGHCPRIDVSNVDFTYPGSQTAAISGIGFTIEPGQSVAIVGENGSGKSTLIKVLLGLYLHEGEVLYDGIGTHSIDKRAFLEGVSTLFQDFGEYQLPLRETVGIGRVAEIGDDARLEKALLAGGGRHILERLGGWDTHVGLEFGLGTQLSTGEWQRLAIARVLFRDAPVLFLDEPTASLDPLAEEQLLQLVLGAMKGRTVVIVSHRLSVCPRVDKILVMHQGKMLQQGSHTELVGAQGLYRDMFLTQSEWYNTTEVADEGIHRPAS